MKLLAQDNRFQIWLVLQLFSLRYLGGLLAQDTLLAALAGEEMRTTLISTSPTVSAQRNYNFSAIFIMSRRVPMSRR
ncbi:hypothetical protein DFS34DRAFT_447429 [Phlyctochytrium arcticum]|nr:hypothetical protein DFS34DRAFT_500760 [Phlyctochytrium arcticum]KAI9088503.1 hypothetical protein DFS34DRAFT_447429 [Phlyctochytrium arcticum]